MKNIQLLWCILLLTRCATAFATVHRVGPGATYASPNHLYTAGVVGHGDTILIQQALYSGVDALAVWQFNDLYISGIGGRPVLDAAGQYIWGKGIWVLAGNNITVENIAFTGAAVPDQNGAGIRLDGIGLTVRHCHFFDNENGILTSNPFAGDIVVEYCEFDNNGHGDGYSHNLYIGHVASLTFRFNYSHHAYIGHCLKSRAQVNYIAYNRIMDEDTGQSSRLIDLPNGGTAVVIGNLLMQGPLAENNNLVGFGLEGLSNSAPHNLYVVNNTLVNKRTASCVFIFAANGATAAAWNNIFAGTGTLSSNAFAQFGGNLVAEDIAFAQFSDESGYDYTLLPNSPAIDIGQVSGDSVDGFALHPDLSYLHPAGAHLRPLSGFAIDAGAYEYTSPTTTLEALTASGRPFPNPAASVLYWPESVTDIVVYSTATGALLRQRQQWDNSIDLSDLPQGYYWISWRAADGKPDGCMIMLLPR